MESIHQKKFGKEKCLYSLTILRGRPCRCQTLPSTSSRKLWRKLARKPRSCFPRSRTRYSRLKLAPSASAGIRWRLCQLFDLLLNENVSPEFELEPVEVLLCAILQGVSPFRIRSPRRFRQWRHGGSGRQETGGNKEKLTHSGLSIVTTLCTARLSLAHGTTRFSHSRGRSFSA